jgi:hypothetical protein
MPIRASSSAYRAMGQVSGCWDKLKGGVTLRGPREGGVGER